MIDMPTVRTAARRARRKLRDLARLPPGVAARSLRLSSKVAPGQALDLPVVAAPRSVLENDGLTEPL